MVSRLMKQPLNWQKRARACCGKLWPKKCLVIIVGIWRDILWLLETDRIAMILQGDGKPIGMCFVGRAGLVGCGAYQFGVVVHQDVVVENGKIGRAFHFTFVVEPGSMEYDVVSLPFPWRAAGVDCGRVLGIQRSCHSIGVCFIVIAIQDLNFVDVH